MAASLGRFLLGPPAPIIGALAAAQLLAAYVPGLMFGFLLVAVASGFLFLSRPYQETSTILASAWVIYALVVLVLNSDVAAALLPLIYLLTPALLGLILRRSGSLSLMILGGYAFGWLMALLLGSNIPGLEAGLTAAAEKFQELATEAGQPEPLVGMFGELVMRAGMELVMASTMTLLILLLFVARSLQGITNGQPTFRSEFRAVRYGYAAAVLFFGVLLAVWWQPDSALLMGLMLTLLMVFLFPGIALAHRLSDLIRYPLAVLVPFYVLLLGVHQMFLFVATVGAVDNLLELSRRMLPDSSSR